MASQRAVSPDEARDFERRVLDAFAEVASSSLFGAQGRRLASASVRGAYPDTVVDVRYVADGAEMVESFALWAGDLVAGDPRDPAEARETALLLAVNAAGL